MGRPARDRTSALATLSCQDMPRIHASHVECIEPSLLSGTCSSCLAAIVDRLSTLALGLVHTRAVRRARVGATFQIPLSISASKERLSVIVEPR